MSGAAGELAREAAAAEREAVRLAVAAGERVLALRGRLGPDQVGFKGARDLVTAADLEAERVLTDGLTKAFPDHAVLAEEASSAAGAGGAREHAVALDAERWTWILDPLDGTTNFAHDHPFFAVSVALCRGREPWLGVVFAPALGELFVARKGAGATKNGRPLRVSQTTALGDAIVATGFPYRRNELPPLENNVEHFHRFILDVRGFRRCGAASIDLAYVAAGRYDVFFEAQLEAWDVAAGAILVREAGGTVTDQKGGDDWLTGRRLLASNGALHAVALERLQPEWRRG